MEFGSKMKDGRYPLEMLSNSKHKVIQFTFNTKKYVTSKGIKVGSSESSLTSKYTSMKRHHTTRFNHYVLGSRPFTDFWVMNSSGRVYQVIVRAK